MERPRLSVVVPAYNEAAVIASTVAALRQRLAPVDPLLEILVADDASTDGTPAIARAAGAEAVSLNRHRGKGAAVRAGMLKATGRTVAFVDADLAYSPDDLMRLLEHVEAGSDVAVGTRRHHYVVTGGLARPVRRASSRAFTALTGSVLLGEPRDTQCGIKAFEAAAAREIFTRARIDGFAFDVEIFVIVQELQLSLTEVAVAPSYGDRTSVRLGRHAPDMVRDLMRIRRYARRGGYATGSLAGR